MIIRHLFAVLLLPALPVPGGSAAPRACTAGMLFEGTSTLHDFKGTVDARPFVTAWPEEEPATGSAAVMVKVAGMTTRHARRDKTMYRMLDLEHWAGMRGVVKKQPLPLVLSLKDFGLKPPSVLGLIRVGDTVTVHGRVTLQQGHGPVNLREAL